MTKSDFKFLRAICRQYKIKCSFFKNKRPYAGYAKPYQSFICISRTLSGDRFRSVLLHEVAHVLNYRNDKFPIYHGPISNPKRNKAYLRKYALKAEIYTEKVAMKLGRKHKLKYYYRFYYNTKICQDAIKEHYGL